ncbi:hypothetical protein ECG_07292 [Echinococcus granulosus]|uniref:GNAT family N-acetyltransferase n=1 Tax=Echinococcus granulosus TaxID=6210 RepID=A0A068WU07_ECHGR|nr:hypothetical protein ECG_07292 [Echinococcus granulosus]CDS21963.1 hypothetical protein EgrG_000070800 [Echinococcus granulosus]
MNSVDVTETIDLERRRSWDGSDVFTDCLLAIDRLPTTAYCREAEWRSFTPPARIPYCCTCINPTSLNRE